MPTPPDRRPRRAVISGHLIQLARASAGVSQERLADLLGVSRTTMQAWETGRRPVSSMAHGDVVELHQRLLHLGAVPDLIDLFGPAAEADAILAAVIDLPATSIDLDRHPLGWTVLRQTVAELIMWATSGQTPPVCAALPERTRRGPQAAGPELDPVDEASFFESLRVLADRARGHHSLLHRQAVFLGSAKPGAGAAAWARADADVLAHLRRPMGWTPHWPSARSLAIARARTGDRDALREFVQHADDAWEQANLAYWAYWAGDLHGRQANDDFMAAPSGMRWRGTRLYAHLSKRLDPAAAGAELNIHSLWSLLQVRPQLPAGDAESTARILGQAEPVLDSGVLSARAEGELRSVRYALTVLNRMTREYP